MGSLVALPSARPGTAAVRAVSTDLAAERAVLAAALLDPASGREVVPRLRGYLPTGAAFGDPHHGVVWEAILAVCDRGEPLDVLTLAGELEARGALRKLPGAVQFLGELTTEHLGTAHCEAHARLVAEGAARRALATVASDLMAGAVDPAHAPLATREAAVRALAGVRVGTDAPARLGAAFDGLLARWEAVANGTAPSSAVSTGLGAWDDVTAGGVHDGELVVLAARPRIGKTALVVQVLTHVARSRGPVYFASLEMSRAEIAERQLACAAWVPYDHVLHAERQTQEDAIALTRAMADLDRLPLFVRDRKPCTVADLAAACRATKARTGLACVAVDHLGKLEPTRHYRERRDAVREIAVGLSDLAEELQVPVIVLAHLNREVAKGALYRRPRLEDLAESSGIEAEADTVVILHREDLYPTEKHSAPPPRGRIDALVQKQRKGDSGAVFQLDFVGEFQRFTEVRG